MVLELGMGTDIRGEDYTKAAIRALSNALRQNSLTVADAFNVPREDMHVKIIVCLLYTSPSPRDQRGSRMPSSA